VSRVFYLARFKPDDSGIEYKRSLVSPGLFVAGVR
jgi:hypothetical protein